MHRKTLRQGVKVSGIGLHTGEMANVVLHPAEAGRGIFFQVKTGDLQVGIPALTPFVIDTHRRVTLGKDGVTVQTVEHLLATFFGLGITDAIVEVNGLELPAGDGSALIWVDAIKRAGIEPLSESAPTLSVTKPLTIEDSKAKICVAPYEWFVACYTFATEHPLVGVQDVHFDELSDDFVMQIAPARTFGFIEEVKGLWEKGLAKGGSFENAIIIFPNHYSSPLHFPNELARHKLLDLMGDLALLGMRLKAKFIAQGSGHSLHHRLCQSLWRLAAQEEKG